MDEPTGAEVKDSQDGTSPGWMTERGAERIARKRERFAELEKEPMGVRILVVLAASSVGPSDIAERLEAPLPSVSRKLSELEDEGLVRWERSPHDRRRHKYSLTAEGSTRLNDHRAFGSVVRAPEPPTTDEAAEFLHAAVRTAIGERRRSNQLDDAAARLARVCERAEAREAYEVALDATAELAITSRQARRRETMREMLNRLETFCADPPASGLERAAAAHLEYALGRAGDERDEDLPTRASRLTTAGNLYRQLASGPTERRAAAWKERQAWCVVSYAGNLRKQSKFELALKEAAVALSLFNELEDSYGRSYSFFMIGFCLRLLGDFSEAWDCLDKAHQLAEEHTFERFRVDSLMQKGEVRRCQGRVGEARGLLKESLARAESLDLVLTQAFARVALGAVAYQDQELADAREELTRACQLFEQCRHAEGIALSARRQSTVVRKLVEHGESTGYTGVVRLIKRARSLYSKMESPAGVAACEIERGRVAIDHHHDDLAATLDQLTALLDDREELDLLELDPWVPRVLDAFAGEVGDTEFEQRAHRIRGSAEKLLAGRAERGLAEVKKIVVDGIVKEVGERWPDDRVDEMGGETRRETSGLMVAPA